MKRADSGLQVHGLLYLSDAPTGQEAPNMRRRLSVGQRHAHYLAMAHRLAGGLETHWGRTLRLLTNSASRLDTAYDQWLHDSRERRRRFEIVEIEFSPGLPTTATFHAASNKIHAFRWFAQQCHPSMLLDLDVICRGPLLPSVHDLIDRGLPLVLDLTDHVPVEVRSGRMIDELARLAPGHGAFRWFGGEFICAGPAFFGALYECVHRMLPEYRRIHDSLFHQGDEMLVSAALAQPHAGHQACDVSTLGVIQRQWLIVSGGDCKRLRPPLPALLHLPGAKALLVSKLSDESIVRLCRLLDQTPAPLSRKVLRILAVLLRSR
jgi:hypothetical protein